jgi:site-specific DNA-methyltransferase (adenine-specific)
LTIHKLKLIYKDEYVKLIQGDCLEVMDKMIEKGIKFDAVITDMPYGTTQNKWDSIIPLDEMWKRVNKLKHDRTPIILFAQTPFDKVLGYSNIKELKYEWIWNKLSPTGHLNAKKMPMKKTENILIFYKKLPTYNPQGLEYCPRIKKRSSKSIGSSNYGKHNDENLSEYKGYPTNLLEFMREGGLHPTQKPVALLEYLINTYTNENDIVLDFTCGSGTTLVAAKKLKRKAIGIELDENYCDIAKKRILDVVVENT